MSVDVVTGELGENLHLSGGFLWMYDGVSAVEHGFHVFPEGVTVDAGSGSISYDYVATYEWTDGRGNIHRSAASVPVTHLQSVGIDGSHTVTVTVPTLRLTAKRNPRAEVEIVIYRTQWPIPATGPAVFYRVTPVTSPLYNDPTVDTLDFVDTVTDVVLTDNPTLYTTGGVVDDIAMPPTSIMAVHQNRIYAVDDENPLTVWFSKVVIPTAPAEFSDLLTFNVDPRGGDVTGLASLDNKLIVFKTGSIFFQVGQGPDSTGNNNDFSGCQLVTSDGGCTNQQSIVLTPAGLMYQSGKGIYLLDRGLQVTYVGADVEAYNSDTVTSSALIPNTTQVRFTLASGSALMFDYLAGQWSVHTNINAAGSCTFENVFTFVQPTGQVRQETPGVFSDAGQPIKLRLWTSWIQLAGLQGYQRFWKLLILGEYISAHQLLCKIAYDFNSSAVQTVSVDAASLLSTSVYGGDATYGSGSPYGGTFPLYQWRIFPQSGRGRCQAIQIQLEDVQTTPSEGLSLSALGLEIGVEPGLARKQSARSFG